MPKHRKAIATAFVIIGFCLMLPWGFAVALAGFVSDCLEGDP
jgi:hypothetical protein